MPEATVRPARDGEYDELLGVWRRAVEATHHFLSGADIDWYSDVVRRYLPLMPDLRVAAAEDDRPLGFIGAEGGEIQMLFVDPVAHGRGVGTALLDSVAAQHEELRVDVNEENASGRRFYERRGFVQVGRSALDGEGRPFPILHLRRTATRPTDTSR